MGLLEIIRGELLGLPSLEGRDLAEDGQQVDLRQRDHWVLAGLQKDPQRFKRAAFDRGLLLLPLHDLRDRRHRRIDPISS